MKIFTYKSLIVVFLVLLIGIGTFSVYKKVQAQSATYHASSDAIFNDLKAIAASNPSIAKIVELSPKSIDGRTILAIKISKDAASNKNKTRILFEGGHHAREWIAPEVSLSLARHLVSSYNSDATIKSYIDNQEIWIVPLVNPDGYQYTKGGGNNRMWRKNRRDNGGSCSNTSTGWGVDNNRNWGPKWGGEGASANCNDETYRGKAAYSEPENQALKNLMQQYRFSTVVSYHSFSQLVLYPYGNTTSPAPDKPLLHAMASKMSSLIKAVHGKTYKAEPASTMYVATGDTSDYAYETFKIPAFTIELRPTENDTSGFALPASQIIPTWEENKPAALYLIDLLNLNVTVPTQAAPLTAKQGDKLKLTVKGLWRGKTAANFAVKIGGVNATVNSATRQAEVSGGTVQNAYLLDVTAPALAAGKHDLQVIVGDAVDTESQAIVYNQGAVTPTPSVGPTANPTAAVSPTTVPTVATTLSPVVTTDPCEETVIQRSQRNHKTGGGGLLKDLIEIILELFKFILYISSPSPVPVPTSTPTPIPSPTPVEEDPCPPGEEEPTITPTVNPTVVPTGSTISPTVGSTVTPEVTIDPCEESEIEEPSQRNHKNGKNKPGGGLLKDLIQVILELFKLIINAPPAPSPAITPTPIPTSSPSPIPSEDPCPPDEEPTVSVTAIPNISVTPTPTITGPIPSLTCLGSCPTLPVDNNNRTKFVVEISLHGIGNSGDNTNPTLSTFSNKNPKHTSLNGTVYLVNSNRTVVAEATGQVLYASEIGSYKGVIQLNASIQDGVYTVKLKTPYHLARTANRIQAINNGSTYTLPAVHLIAGNLDNDDKLDILDYALFLDCFGASSANKCTEEKKIAADLNDDGIVNSVDYNLFIRELSVQVGE